MNMLAAVAAAARRRLGGPRRRGPGAQPGPEPADHGHERARPRPCAVGHEVRPSSSAACPRCCSSRRCRRDLRIAGLVLAGVALFWVWGVGSAALALADTDMPGEAPDPHRRRARPDRDGGLHRRRGRRDHPVAPPCCATRVCPEWPRWRCPSRSPRRAALVVQFVAFGAAAREAQAAMPAAGTRRRFGRRRSMVAAELVERRLAAPPPLAGVPPQLGARSGPDADAGLPAGTACRRRVRRPARPRQLRRPLPAHLRRAADGLDAARRARPPLGLRVRSVLLLRQVRSDV